jgi:hypothetical protein
MEPRPYAVPLEDLVRTARVPVEDQITEQDTSQDQEPEPDLWPQLRWPN